VYTNDDFKNAEAALLLGEFQQLEQSVLVYTQADPVFQKENKKFFFRALLDERRDAIFKAFAKTTAIKSAYGQSLLIKMGENGDLAKAMSFLPLPQ
jgi:hypothetical protein